MRPLILSAFAGLRASRGSVTEAVRDIGVVLDTIGGDTVERSLEVLRPGGHLVTAVAEEDSELAAQYEEPAR